MRADIHQTTVTVTTGEVVVHEDGRVSETRETREVPADEYIAAIHAFLRDLNNCSESQTMPDLTPKTTAWKPIICRTCGVGTHPKVDECDACHRISSAQRRRAERRAKKERPRIKGVRL